MTPERIKHIRVFLGRTQAQMANLVTSTAITIGRWERGESKPSPIFLEKLVKLDNYAKKMEESYKTEKV